MVLVIFTGKTNKINRIIHAKKLYNILSRIKPTEIIFSETSEKLKKSKDIPPATHFVKTERINGDPITRAIKETFTIWKEFRDVITKHRKIIIAGNNPILSLSLRLAGKKTYYFAGGLNYKNKPPVDKVISFLKEVAMGFSVNKIIVESTFMKKYYSAFFEIFDKKTAYNGRLYVDKYFREIVPWRKRPQNLIFIGALEKEKGILELIDEMKNIPDWNLIVIGQGSLKPQIQQKTRSMKNIKFIGFVKKYSDLPKFLNKARFLILPTKHGEGVPNIVLESLSCGTPVIAYNTGAINAIIRNGQTGHIIEKIDEIRHVIKKWYEKSAIDSNYGISVASKNYETLLSE